MKAFFTPLNLVLFMFLLPFFACDQKEEKRDKAVIKTADRELVLINAERLITSFDSLASFDDPLTKGNDRIAFSDYNIQALQWIRKDLTELGLDVSIDYAGNLIAKRAGRDSTLSPIGFGSHIDCVPNGGHYDGQVGVLAGIEVLKVLNDKNIQTKHPLEFIVFSNEEGGVLGSRALAGAIEDETLDVMTASGLTNGQGIDRLGGDSERIFEVARADNAFHAFLELHIEQGAILEESGLDIGVVQGIVGLRWWDVEITGFSNHAGTTPMDRRQDAMLAAAEFTLAVNEIVRKMEGTQVGTVGRIKAFPGVPNVIPGKVVLSLELRDLSNDVLDQLFAQIEDRSAFIGEKYNTSFEFRSISATGEPALTSITIQDLIEEICTGLGHSSKRLPSGAGHDAQEMALLGPTGMIFIPSKGGVSHSPDEYSTFKEMTNGANVLLNTILELDQIDNISD